VEIGLEPDRLAAIGVKQSVRCISGAKRTLKRAFELCDACVRGFEVFRLHFRARKQRARHEAMAAIRAFGVPSHSLGR
jgi:hypothetical protein